VLPSLVPPSMPASGDFMKHAPAAPELGSHVWSEVQSLFIVQPHSPEDTTHTGVAEPAVHSIELVVEHCVHWPAEGPVVWQAGVGMLQSESVAHGPQVPAVMLQMGVSPEQFEFVRHPTQVSLAGLQTAVGALQLVFVRHATHAPVFAPDVAHRGVVGKLAQSVLVAHGAQTLVERLQMGVVPEQSELLVHPTHVPVAASHTGEAPLQSVRLVAEHCVHSPMSGPLVWQAGVVPPHWESLVQPSH
jgi:hypothetical protein